MDKKKLDKLVEETMNSMDAADKAMPAPFLLTRIKARMDRDPLTSSPWERVSALLGKPFIAFPVLALVITVNFFIIRSAVSASHVSPADYTKVSTDDYSLSTATSLFDLENGQR
ncbi:MAG: hypothetical protein EOO13_12910 [Chitinophagaceae bacterium]|nr:MAG: hypothetical protein EOO13_12910 [Chitinophagaceae bacterium]